MRVLHVIPSVAARTGGPPVAVVESSLALARCGVECTIMATDLAETASARTRGRLSPSDMPAGAGGLDVRTYPLPAGPSGRFPGRLAFSPALWRAVHDEAHRCDVVHIHSLFLFPQFAAWRAARAAGVPYVVSPRGALDPYLRRRNATTKAASDALWGRAMLAGAAALHLTSDQEARWLADAVAGVPRAVIPNGIRWPQFQHLPPADEFRARYLGGHDGPLVMYLGRLSHKKGLDVLVRAFALARRDAPAARLAVVGPDDEGLTPALRALTAREGVAEAVTFTGMLHGRDKLAALAATDVWALPSHGENFGIAVAEALAAGRAVVVSPGVNIAPEIAAADAGIVRERTPEAFGAAIASLLRDAGERERLGERACMFARRYDWSEVAPRLAELYEHVAGTRAGERIAA